MAENQAKSVPSSVPVSSCGDRDPPDSSVPACAIPSCSKPKLPFSTGMKKVRPYNNEEEEAAKREEAQQVIRYLAVSTAPLKDYFGGSTDLPDNFLLYSIADKLKFSMAIMHSFSNFIIAQQVETAGLTGTIEGKQATDNIETIFTSMIMELNRLRELSIRLPPTITTPK